MSIFSRLFKIGQAEAHTVVNRLEDPIKMMEQGIRDLKRDLQGAMTGLAEVKGVAVRLSKEAEDAKRQVEFLAQAEVKTSRDAMGTAYKKAGKVCDAIESTKWELLEAVAQLSDERKVAARGILAQLVEALTHDEYAIALQPRLSKLEGDAIRLLTPTPKPPIAPPKPPPTQPSPGRKVIDTADKQGVLATDAGALLADLRNKLAADTTLKVDLSWTLYKEEGE